MITKKKKWREDPEVLARVKAASRRRFELDQWWQGLTNTEREYVIANFKDREKTIKELNLESNQ